MIRLNRAVALAKVEGAAAALAAVDELDLAQYHFFHATRAELLTRLGRTEESVLAYDAALALVSNAVERDPLQRRRREADAVRSSPPPLAT